uniref:Uncharacterized protein n=1 Tax=Setaria italica TaxID=4555 RepID=K4AGY2_SETIT
MDSQRLMILQWRSLFFSFVAYDSTSQSTCARKRSVRCCCGCNHKSSTTSPSSTAAESDKETSARTGRCALTNLVGWRKDKMAALSLPRFECNLMRECDHGAQALNRIKN